MRSVHLVLRSLSPDYHRIVGWEGVLVVLIEVNSCMSNTADEHKWHQN